ncbi:Crp/Fnr family transcriptional regulator [Mucilaginibacter sp. P19]|uniref:Crp/Fnr family transcriptional regulator n=1 Tax=Mucilaginibacter sp. P19 TaxID=3423947 RepID=UPI003D67844F
MMDLKSKYGFSLIEFINRDLQLDEYTINLISDNCKELTFAKGDIILKQGEVSKYAYFIVSGEGRSFYTDFTGKTTTWLFHFNNASSNIKNLFMVDYKSFLTGKPGTLGIETLSEVKAVRLSYKQVRLLLKHSPSYEKWTRLLNEKVFIVAYNRVFTLLTMNATQRYEKLLAEEPYLLILFSNYYIASYLNITPQSLSRIRKNLVKIPISGHGQVSH